MRDFFPWHPAILPDLGTEIGMRIRRLWVAFALTTLLQAGCCCWPHWGHCGHHCCSSPNEEAPAAVLVPSAPLDGSTDADSQPTQERPVMQ
jgi:hypothetical protein